MLQEKEDAYSLLEVDKYLQPLKPYVAEHREKFRPDTVSFILLWGSRIVFYVLTILCFLTAVFTFHTLPERIPVQWSGGEVTGEMGRAFIFAYAAGCILCRLIVRPLIWKRLRMRPTAADILTDYLTNFLCLALFSIELFSLLYLAGVLHHVTWVLAFDAGNAGGGNPPRLYDVRITLTDDWRKIKQEKGGK